MKQQLKILFVDDEPNILNGLKRMLRGMREQWQMTFVGNSEEALRVLEQENYDVIISDMRMPGMNGAELLLEIQKRYPKMIRIILSGHTDKDMILKSVKPAHQYLSKPCDADVMVRTVGRANALRELLHDEKITSVVSRIETLPSLPTLYQKIMAELSSKNSSLQKVGEIISEDVSMTAKILQLVNSAYFGLPRQITNPSQAVSLLGIETLKALVLSVHIFSQFEERNVPGFSIDRLRTHSLNTAFAVKNVAAEEDLNKRVVDELFMAGLLHDAGKIVLASAFPQAYSEALSLAKQKEIPDWQAEKEVFAAAHSEIGAYLLGLWGLSDLIVESIASHHHPDHFEEDEFMPMTIVYFVNRMEHQFNGNDFRDNLDPALVDVLKQKNKLDRWKVLCRPNKKME